MTDLTKLAPCEVWTEFEAITRVPRPSKKEEKIRDYLVGWAKEHGLEYRCDATGNVVIRKPATTGYEGRPTVILQSHMDMVCEKNSDVAFDFEHDAIRTRIDDGWVRAEGTTLGADDGIGMAAALAMLASATVAHPALEALFTVDEETGLTGAFGLGEGMLTGKYLINLDSEDEGELFIGCAGGVDTVAKFSPMVTPAPDGFEYFRIDVKGLAGGHSGDDIEKGRANSNKLVARLLYELLPYGPVLNRFDGGNLRNAIPREAFAVFGVPAETAGDVCERCRAFAVEIVEEFKYTEPNLQMTLNKIEGVEWVLDPVTMQSLVGALVGLPNGVLAMSHAVEGRDLVESGIGEVRCRGDRGHYVAAFVGGERQALCRTDRRGGAAALRRRSRSFGRLSRLVARSRFVPAARHGAVLRAAFRREAQSTGHPCRIGVRAVLGEISGVGHGVVRPDAARRAFARRAAGNRHRAEVLGSALRRGGESLSVGDLKKRGASLSDAPLFFGRCGSMPAAVHRFRTGCPAIYCLPPCLLPPSIMSSLEIDLRVFLTWTFCFPKRQ